MSTHVTKPSEIQRECYVVDAEGKILGRLATRVASLLRGKGKVNYSPHLDTGDFVIVVNAARVELSGDKRERKRYFSHSGYPGGARYVQLSKMMETRPEEVIRRAVRGMLPKNKLGRKMLRKLRVYAGPEHPHGAQRPQAIDV
jgi:large subunit ribosomal protein L13